MKSTITLKLPEEFLKLCAQDNTTPETVLRGFVADLCDLATKDYATNGSDERMYAEQYYDRCGYRFMAELARKARGDA